MAVDKRRRKKARIQTETSSEDESSAVESTHESADELSELSEDEEMHSPKESVKPSDEAPRELLHKMPHNSDLDFNQVFLKLVTEQFGDDLAALRQSNDFTPASISQLVAGLKQGADIFSPEQQMILAKEDN